MQPYGQANSRSIEDGTDDDDDISRMTSNNNVFDDHISFTTHENMGSVVRPKEMQSDYEGIVSGASLHSNA